MERGHLRSKDSRELGRTGYFVAVAATLGAILLRTLFEPVVGEHQPLIISSLAVIVVSLFYGLGPGMLCLGLSILIDVPLFMSPNYTVIMSPDALMYLFSFTLVNVVIVCLAQRQRLAKEAADTNALEVTRLNQELEARVNQRTAELREANADLSGFMNSIAHDMRQYLRGINVAVHTIMEDQMERLDEDGQTNLSSLGRNARQASELAEGLLEFARLGKNELVRREVSVSGVASEVAQRLTRLEKECKPEFEVQPGMTASCDAQLLQIAFQNILENACKYRIKGTDPKVRVGCLETDGEVIFYVTDNGVGFDMRFVDRVFQPFERLHRATDYPGTGIGMANVKRIIDKHGGRIWAESAASKGSTFYFTLQGRAEARRAA